MANEKSGGKLHQVLAVDGELKGTYDKILGECLKTFKERSAHYQGHAKTYSKTLDEDLDIPANDIKEPTDTVPSKLKYIQGAVIKHLDAIYQKELANTEAKADLIVEHEDGTVETIEAGVPATVLLNLETKLKEIRGVYDSAPTYDPEKRWKKLTGEEGVYVTDPVKTIRSRKVEEVLLLIAPTQYHPGQAKTTMVDKNVGEWQTVFKSGALSPLEKSQLLGKLDLLIQSVKKARQKANDQDVKAVRIGQKLFNFIHKEA